MSTTDTMMPLLTAPWPGRFGEQLPTHPLPGAARGNSQSRRPLDWHHDPRDVSIAAAELWSLADPSRDRCYWTGLARRPAAIPIRRA
jgi:hypothetical protein